MALARRFMGSAPPYSPVDLDRLERLLWILSILGLAIAVVGVIGELRGWWNDVGELLISFGTVASVATAVVVLLIYATKGQVHRVADGVEGNGVKIEAMHQDLGGKIEAMHQDLGGKMGAMHQDLGGKMEAMHQDLGGKLDTVHQDLVNQHDVLIQIRDRL